MVITILAFGVAKNIIGRQKFNLDVEKNSTAKQLKEILCSKYKKLSTIPFLLAVNLSHAKENTKLKQGDEVAIIPPTNGG